PGNPASPADAQRRGDHQPALTQSCPLSSPLSPLGRGVGGEGFFSRDQPARVHPLTSIPGDQGADLVLRRTFRNEESGIVAEDRLEAAREESAQFRQWLARLKG